MNTHVVTKPFSTGAESLELGTEVDASEWKNARLLEEQRFIRPLDGVRAEPWMTTANPAESSEFYQRVVDGVIAKLRESGELAQLIQPNGREPRMGRKDQQNAKSGN